MDGHARNVTETALGSYKCRIAGINPGPQPFEEELMIALRPFSLDWHALELANVAEELGATVVSVDRCNVWLRVRDDKHIDQIDSEFMKRAERQMSHEQPLRSNRGD